MNSPVASNAPGPNQLKTALGLPPQMNLATTATPQADSSKKAADRARKGLTIEVSDERRCNLEDDESFEDATSKPVPGRQVMTPGAGASVQRKNSINITPKSRVIEPGKIFNSRQMTPASAASGMRGRMSGLGLGLSSNLISNSNSQIRLAKQSRSNLIMAGAPEISRQFQTASGVVGGSQRAGQHQQQL